MTAALSHGKDGSLRNEHIQFCSAPVIQGSRHEEAQLVCASLIGDKAARNLLHTFRGCKMELRFFPFLKLSGYSDTSRSEETPISGHGLRGRGRGRGKIQLGSTFKGLSTNRICSSLHNPCLSLVWLELINPFPRGELGVHR